MNKGTRKVLGACLSDIGGLSLRESNLEEIRLEQKQSRMKYVISVGYVSYGMRDFIIFSF